MVNNANGTPGKPKHLWLVLAGLLAVAVFMYASIMYKIIHYGP